MAELPNRDALEARFALMLARAGSAQRRKLEALLGNPPDIRNVPAKFWDDRQRELEAALLILLGDVFTQSARYHGWGDNPKDRETITAVKEASATWAQSHAKKIAQGFRDNSETILERGAKRWAEQREQVNRQRQDDELEPFPDDHPIPRSDIRDTTLDIFGPKRMERVAVNETTAARHEGSERAVEETVGLNEDDTWHTSERQNVCPICRPLNKKPRSVWARLFPEGPPSPHVECNCWIDYAVAKAEPAEPMELVG